MLILSSATTFDPSVFLAQAGLGRQIIDLKPKDFFCQGRQGRCGLLLAERQSKAHSRIANRQGSHSVLCVNDDKNEYAHFVTIGLLAEEFSGDAKVMEPDEITEWKWFDLNELPRPLYFPSEKMLNNYLQKRFYIPLK